MAKDEAPSEENAELPEEGAKPRKKKLLLIIIAVVVLVVVSGIGIAVYVMNKTPDAEQQADQPAEEESHEAADEEEHPPIYEKLDSFTVRLSDQETYLRAELSLKMADPVIQEKIKAHMPEVRDLLLRLLSSKAPEELSGPEGTEALADEIKREVNGLIGVKNPDEGVMGVLFTDFILQ